MFVKLLGSIPEEETILNINEISSIQKSSYFVDEKKGYEYLVRMANNSTLELDKEQYEQLCRVLTKTV